MKQSFVIVNSKSSDALHLHYKECKRQNLPYVAIHPRRKFAYVELDMGPVDRDLDKKSRFEIQEIMLKHGAMERNTLCGEAFCRAEKIKLSTAYGLAQQMFEVVEKAIPRLIPFGKNQNCLLT